MVDFIKKYKWFLVSGVILVILAIVLFFVFNKSPRKEIELEENESTIMEIGKCNYSDVYFETKNDSVAIVDQSGKIIAFGAGKTEVIARNSKNKICMIYEVKVKLPNVDVEVLKVIDRIEASDITLNVGEIKNIEYTVDPSDADERVYFISENENIVTVSSDGKIRGVSSGSVNVTLMSESGSVKKNIVVTVNNLQNDESSDKSNDKSNDKSDNNADNDKKNESNSKKEEVKKSLKILESLVFIEKGSNYNLKYEVNGVSEEELKWNSSDSSVATVSNSGVITAVGVGKAIITVSGPSIMSAIVINVIDTSVIRSVNIVENSINLNIGGSYNLNVAITPEHLSNEVLTWSSSDSSVVSVDNGALIAHKAGKAVVTVKTSNNKKDTITVNVVSNVIPIESISLNGESKLTNGDSTNFIYKINPSNATHTSVVWSTSNSNVATVSQSGRVTAVGVGTATITVTTSDGKSASKVVTVQKNRQITSSDFLSVSSSGPYIQKKSGETVVLRGVNLGLWLSRSYWGLNLNSTNNRNDSLRVSDVNNIQMNYEMHNNVNIQNYAKQNGKTVHVVVNELNETLYDNFITEYDLDVIAEMGVNVVRVPLEWSYFVDVTFDGKNYKYEWDLNFSATPFLSKRIERLDWIVSECSKRGIYVIFDIHVAEGGLNIGGYRSNPVFFKSEGAQYRENTIRLWEYIANRYKNNPGVAGYDLVNEPGTLGTSVTSESIRNFYIAAYNGIRDAGDNHIIIMEMPFISGDDSANNLGAPDKNWNNVVYSLHDYIWYKDPPDNNDMSAKTQYEYSRMKSLFDQKLKKTIQVMNEYNVPIFIGEFSGMRPYGDNDTSMWEYMMNSYDKNNISYAGWTYKAAYFDYMSLVYMTPTSNRVHLQTASYEDIKNLFSQNSQNGVFKIGNKDAATSSGISLKNATYYNIFKNHFNGDVGNVVWGTNSSYSCNAGYSFVATVRTISNNGKSTINSLSTSNSSIATIAKITDSNSSCKGATNCATVRVKCLKTGSVNLIAKSSTGATATASTNVTLIRFGTNSSYKCKAGEKITATIKVEGGISVKSYNSSNTNIAKIIQHPSAGPTCTGCATVQIQCINKGTTTLNAYSDVGTSANVNVTVS